MSKKSSTFAAAKVFRISGYETNRNDRDTYSGGLDDELGRGTEGSAGRDSNHEASGCLSIGGPIRRTVAVIG